MHYATWAATPIGMGYRVCGRFGCPQRAASLLGHPLRIGPYRWHVGALPRAADSRGEAAPVVKRRRPARAGGSR
ncbi:short-chain fatty acyl-CoA regulator family protein [Streptomyces sp. NBC_01483]|uniref:short-chain fatty acyl-CoA regulator family protein n=1 Tax=Streptomyces sp. NBC_01483 TaxID=2903883 RepID=UPI003FCED4C3